MCPMAKPHNFNSEGATESNMQIARPVSVVFNMMNGLLAYYMVDTLTLTTCQIAVNVD